MEKRSINIDGMDEAAFENLVAQVGAKVSEILNNAKAESDKFLSRYNLTIDLSYNLKSIEIVQGE